VGAGTGTPTLDRVQRLVRRAPEVSAARTRLVAVACWAAAVVLVAGPTWLVFR
jgi:hypothetical protein